MAAPTRVMAAKKNNKSELLSILKVFSHENNLFYAGNDIQKYNIKLSNSHFLGHITPIGLYL